MISTVLGGCHLNGHQAFLDQAGPACDPTALQSQSKEKAGSGAVSVDRVGGEKQQLASGEQYPAGSKRVLCRRQFKNNNKTKVLSCAGNFKQWQ